MDGQTQANTFLYLQDTYDNVSVSEGFPGFDFAQGFHPQQQQQQQHSQSGFVGHGGPPTPPSQGSYNPPSYPGHGHYGSVSHLSGDILAHTKSEADDNGGNGRGSEEDNLTPAQSKRKAQNRAAYVNHFHSFIHSYMHACMAYKPG